MSLQETPQGKQADPVAERLERLDRELMTERSKRFDYVYASRRNIRIKCCVMRVDGNEENKAFTATASVCGLAIRSHGRTPTKAFKELLRSLKWQMQQSRVKTNTGCFFKGTADILCRRCQDCRDHYR